MSNTEFVARNGLVVGGNTRMAVAVGNTAQRPSSPQAGDFRFNTDLGAFEGCSGGGTFGSVVFSGNSNLGSNVSIPGFFSSGNSSVNAVINSTSYSINGVISLNTSAVSTATGAFSSNVQVGPSVTVNTTGFGIGNTTVNFIANSSQAQVGNTIITNLGVNIGNSSVNALVNATSFTGTANNALSLGGILASQYAFANQITGGAATTPGGANTQIQFNSSGAFAGSAGFVWNLNSNTVTVVNAVIVGLTSIINNVITVGSATTTGASVSVGNSTVNTTHNATSFSGTSNNSLFLGGIAAAQYAFANQVTAGGTPGGANTQIQYNSSGAFAGSTGFTWNFNSNTVTVSNAVVVGLVTVGNNSIQVGSPTGTGAFISIGNSTVNSIVNSTFFTDTANNALFLNGVAASGYQTISGLSANVATLTANNSTNFGGIAPSGYFKLTGIQTVTGNTVVVGDITLERTGSTTTGRLWLGSAGTHYLDWDGTNYNMPSSALLVNGSAVLTSATLTNLNQLVNGPGYISTLSAAVAYSCNTMTAVTYLYSDGNIYAQGDVYAAYSDKRLKRDLQPIDRALDLVDKMTGYTYYQNELGATLSHPVSGRQVGLLTQDVEPWLPEVVARAPFDMTEDGSSKSGEDYMTLNYQRLVPVLVNAIKELRAEVRALRDSR